MVANIFPGSRQQSLRLAVTPYRDRLKQADCPPPAIGALALDQSRRPLPSGGPQHRAIESWGSLLALPPQDPATNGLDFASFTNRFRFPELPSQARVRKAMGAWDSGNGNGEKPTDAKFFKLELQISLMKERDSRGCFAPPSASCLGARRAPRPPDPESKRYVLGKLFVATGYGTGITLFTIPWREGFGESA